MSGKERTAKEKRSRIVRVLTKRPSVLNRLAHWLYTGALETCDDDEIRELAEAVCVAAFGARVECPDCHSLVFPGFLCWDCEEWVAPLGTRRQTQEA